MTIQLLDEDKKFKAGFIAGYRQAEEDIKQKILNVPEGILMDKRKIIRKLF